jgi:hypothetical protein
VQASGLRSIKPHEHDLLSQALLDEWEERIPFKAAPLLDFVVATQDRDYELRMRRIEFRQIEHEPRSRKLCLMIGVIEDALFAKLSCEQLRHSIDEGSLFSGKGE